MRWSDRQREMLAGMGLRLPEPPSAAAVAPPVADAPAMAPAAAAQAAAETRAAAGVAVVDRASPSTPDTPRAATPPARPQARTAAAPLGDAPVRPSAADRPDRAEIATLDWQPLRDAVAGCRACTLCETRRHTVFGVGHAQAHWMIVGEAPGEQEDRQGEPFVGPAGHLLDAMLHALGLTRAEAPPERQVFIANTLKCRPPRNRNPDPAELAKCEPFLQRQIALIRPRILLAMGRFAVQTLLRSDEPVGRLRGRVHRYEGVPLVVTYHPAYLLRQPVDKAKAWDDLCLAAEVLAQGEGVSPSSPSAAATSR